MYLTLDTIHVGCILVVFSQTFPCFYNTDIYYMTMAPFYLLWAMERSLHQAGLHIRTRIGHVYTCLNVLYVQ